MEPMNVVYDMVVDFARPSKTNTVLVMQNDANSRVLRFILMNQGRPFDTSGVAIVSIKAVKPDGKVIYDNASVSQDSDGKNINEVVYTVPPALTSTSGQVTMTITLQSAANESISSFENYLLTRNELYNEDDYASDDDLSGFRDILSRATEAVAKIEELTKQSALPNPYPLRIIMGDQTFSYDGSLLVNVPLTGIAYLGDKKKETAVIA